MITSYLNYISLVTQMAGYHKAYHEDGKSLITDEEYDSLRKELIEWEQDNPDQTLELSPSFKVGYLDKEKHQEEFRHDYPLLSLENALNEAQSQVWIDDWVKQYGTEVEVIGEFKYDGMAIALRYLDGNFIRALTRGDGEYGEDVTHHVAKFVPGHISVKGLVEIRGEAIVKHSNLDWINGRDGTYANCRSAVVGLINPNRKDVSYNASQVSFVPYDIESAELVFDKYTQKLEVLKQLDFKMLSCFIITPEKIQEIYTQVKALRDSDALGIDIDGIVFKINDINKQIELGANNHSPRHSFAYKFPPVMGECRITDVVFQVGRYGEITPVAKITATPLQGVVVTSVSLHNEEKMLERNIAIGHSYYVYRSGDVIPHLGKQIPTEGVYTPVAFPKNCPSCYSALVKRGAAYFCDNDNNCLDKRKASITFAVSNEALDIDNVAEQTVALLLRTGTIRCTADLYDLEIADIALLDGFTDYSATKMFYAIYASKETTFDRYIMALGIAEVGKSTAKKLAQKIFIRKALFDLDTPEKVLELKMPDVGLVTATSIAKYFSHLGKRDDAENLLKQIKVPDMGESFPIPGIFGKTFVFTGRFKEARELLENKVLSGGGNVTGSVSASTGYLVVGDKPGSKVQKARILNVDIIDERTFLSLFENTHLGMIDNTPSVSDTLGPILDAPTPVIVDYTKFEQDEQGLHIAYHAEGGDTFELAGSIPLSVETLDDNRPLFVSNNNEDWISSHLPEGTIRLYKIRFTLPKQKIFKTYREYQEVNPGWNEEDRVYVYSKKLEKLLKEGYRMFSVGENERYEIPESFIINPTQYVKSIEKVVTVGKF